MAVLTSQEKYDLIKPLREKAKISAEFAERLEERIKGMSPLEYWAFRGMVLDNIEATLSMAAFHQAIL